MRSVSNYFSLRHPLPCQTVKSILLRWFVGHYCVGLSNVVTQACPRGIA